MQTQLHQQEFTRTILEQQQQAVTMSILNTLAETTKNLKNWIMIFFRNKLEFVIHL